MLLPLSRSVIAANSVLIALASIAVVLRIIARRKQHLPLKTDDFLIIAALVIAFGLCIEGIFAGAINIYAIPIAQLSLSRYHEQKKLIWSDVLMCHLVYGVIKLSILFFYRRIFITPRFRKTTDIFMVIVIAWMITAAFGHIFSTSPVDTWWTAGRRFKTTIAYEIFLTAMAGIDIGLDVFTLLLPVPVIKSLHMSKKRKLSLLGVFSLGFFCVVASAIRLYYVWQLQLVEAGLTSWDRLTSVIAWNDVWAHIEACASIVTACLPTLVPLFKGSLSPESMSGSFRSFFSFGSSSRFALFRSRRTNQEKGSSPASLGPKQTWLELNMTSKFSAARAPRTQDEESLVGNPGSIQVETLFGSQHESRL